MGRIMRYVACCFGYVELNMQKMQLMQEGAGCSSLKISEWSILFLAFFDSIH